MLGKTADVTAVQQLTITTFHRRSLLKTWAVQSDVSKHTDGGTRGGQKCGGKRCSSSKDDLSLERIVKRSRIKKLGELHKDWTEAGAQRATRQRRVEELQLSHSSYKAAPKPGTSHVSTGLTKEHNCCKSRSGVCKKTGEAQIQGVESPA